MGKTKRQKELELYYRGKAATYNLRGKEATKWVREQTKLALAGDKQRKG